jgi:hypothetical protein
MVQAEVTADFLSQPVPLGTVRYGEMTLGQFFGGHARIGGRGRAFTGLEPDLWEVLPAIGSIWEIKPELGLGAGVRQLGRHLRVLNAVDRTRTWVPGLT